MRHAFRVHLLAALSTALLLLTLGPGCSAGPGATLAAGTDFQLQLSSPSVSLAQGGQASVGVRIGWLGDCGCPEVQLAVAGAPAGLEAQFDGNPTATGATLLLRAGPGLAPGSYPLRVLGSRTPLRHSQDLQVVVLPAAADFSVTLNPAVVGLAQGGSAVVGIEVQRLGGFSESVTFSVSGAPTGVSASFSGTPLGPVQAAPNLAAMLLAASPSAMPGVHVLTVSATAVSRTRTATLLLTLQPNGDFALGLAPATLAGQGGNGSAGPVAVTITRAAGFSSAVALSLEGAPPGCTGTFTPAVTTASTASLSLALAGVAAGTYPMTVRGTAGAVSRTATLVLTLTAPPPDFSLPAVTLVAPAGGSASTAVLINPLNGFSAPVTLSASGLPAGVAATFSPNPATPSSGSTLGVAVEASVAPGSYSGILRGVSGSLDHTAPLNLSVAPAADFALALSPSAALSLQVPVAGSSTGTRTVQVMPTGGFNAPVTFTAEGLPPGVTAGFSPNPATGSSSLTLTVGSTAVPGSQTVTVRGVAGALNHTADLFLTLTPAGDFTVALAPASGSVAIPTASTSVTTTSTVTLTPVNGLSGTVALSATGLPAGVSAGFSPATAGLPGSSLLTLSVGLSASPGTSLITVHGIQGGLERTATFSLTLLPPAVPDFTVTPQVSAVTEQPGSSGSMQVSLGSVNNFSGLVSLSLLGTPAGMSATFSPNPVNLPAGGTATVTLFLTTGTSVLGGSYGTTIRGTSSSLVRDAGWLVQVQDFTLSATPASFSFATGGGISGGGSLAITRLLGLSNSISLSTSLPGFSFAFTPPSTAGSAATFSFLGPSLTPAPPAVYTAQITGNAGTWTRTTPVSITVQGFLLGLMPSETSGTGAPPPITLRTIPVGSVAGTATLAMVPSGLFTAGFSPNPVALGSASTWTFSLVSTPSVGTFTLTSNGTSGTYTASRGLVHNLTFSADYYIHVTDSGGTNKISVVNLPAGGSLSLRVFLNAVSGFTGSPGLSLVGAPAGLSAGFAPGAVTTSGPSTFSLNAASSLAPGFYTVDVVAAAPPLSRTATLLVIVP